MATKTTLELEQGDRVWPRGTEEVRICKVTRTHQNRSDGHNFRVAAVGIRTNEIHHWTCGEQAKWSMSVVQDS